jgi:hypothetical protein
MATEWVLAIGGLCVALAAIAVALRAVYRAWKKVDAFLEDWNGEPARPGRAEVPAMPARVAKLETTVAAVDKRLATVEAALNQN